MIKTLIFLTFTLQLTSAAPHTLLYFITEVTPGISFPEFISVGQLDGEQGGYYDSNIRRVILKADWIKKSDDTEHWKMITHHAADEQESFRVMLVNLMKRFNQTGGVHTVQQMLGCELDDDGNKRGYRQIGYDGEDFISLDLNTGTYTASVPQAVPVKLQWEKEFSVSYTKHFLLNECIEWLQKYVEYSRSNLERKVPPEVSLFQKDSSSPVVCHATGFFPKAVMISWQKNGKDLHEDVDLRETLPNGDGTFQKRSTLTVSPEELKNNQYTCVVQHEGLEKKIQISDCAVLSDEGSVGIRTDIIGVVVAVLLLVIIGCAGVFMWKKKKKTGFRLVPVGFRSVSTQDSPTPAPTSTPCLDAVAEPH